MRRSLVAVFVASVVSLAVVGGQPQAPDLVRIDAVAADSSGRLVSDLRSEEFEVIEQGTLRPIKSVQFVTADGRQPAGVIPTPIASSEDERVESGREGTRLFALFLDEYHVTPGPPVASIRTALADFVERQLGPHDLVLIVKPLDSLPSLRLTRDRAAILEAIRSFDGRKGNFEPRNAFEQNFIAPDPRRIEAVRTQISVSALNAIASHLGALTAGRKTILMVSEGFAQGARRRGETLPSLDTVVRSANRSSASIYPIDPRALVAPAVGPTSEPSDAPAVEALRKLAAETNGQALLSRSELTSGWQRIISDASGYYLIAFEPGHSLATGRFHPVDVRVTRPGVSLRARNGYWEPLPDSTEVLRKAAAPSASMARHASPLIRPWFGFTRGADGQTRVQFVWEPVARVPGDRSRSSLPVRLTLNVFDSAGAVTYEQVVEAIPNASSSDGSRSQAMFEVPPGRVLLRMLIEDDESRVLDTDVRDLLVSPLSGPLAMGSPQVFRARNARELRAIESDPDSVPAIGRQFSRTEQLLIRIPVYATDPPQMTARLVSPVGQVMRDLPTSSSTPGLHVVNLPLAGLAAGEYRIDLLATSGRARAQDSIAFRVTP